MTSDQLEKHLRKWKSQMISAGVSMQNIDRKIQELHREYVECIPDTMIPLMKPLKYRHSAETKAKISASSRNRAGHKHGVPLSADHKKKISEGGKGISRNKGVALTDDHRQKIKEGKAEKKKNRAV